MVTLKLWVLIAYLTISAVVGVVTSSIVFYAFFFEPAVPCEPSPVQGKNIQRQGDLVNSGRDKGY